MSSSGTQATPPPSSSNAQFIMQFNWFTYTCRILVKKFYFWCTVAICALLEPFLCAVTPEPNAVLSQIIVLLIAATLFVIQTVGEMSNDWQEIIDQKPKNRSIIHEVIVSFVCKGRNMVELVCFTGGLVFIWYRPGIAALRCFRVFRLLWY